MSYKRDKGGFVCDGCDEKISERDTTVVAVRLTIQLQMNTAQFELCALCASKERANETLLGRFLSDKFCRKSS